jgi:hypothetical protein
MSARPARGGGEKSTDEVEFRRLGFLERRRLFGLAQSNKKLWFLFGCHGFLSTLVYFLCQIWLIKGTQNLGKKISMRNI